MGPEHTTANLIRFGVFEIELASGELRKSGRKIKLQEQPFQVLAALLERPGEVVTRDELRQRLWPGDTFVEFDDGLNTAVRKIRQALGDSAENPRFVETLPRRGYRFIGPVVSAARSASVVRPRRTPIGAAAVMVILGVAAVWLLSRVSLPDERPEQPAVVVPLTSFAGPEWSHSWSPDGNFLAINRYHRGTYDVFVMPRVGGAQIHVTNGPADDFCARWSPDGRWLAYLSNDGVHENVYLIPPAGGTPNKLAGTNVPYLERMDDSYMLLGNNAWSPDGGELLFSRLEANGRIALWRVRLHDGHETQMTDPPAGYDDFQGGWSFDGTQIVFLRRHAGRFALWLLSGAGGEPQPLLADEFTHTHPAWDPDNRRVVFESNRAGAINLWEIAIPSRRLRQLTTGAGSQKRPIISRQGELAYTHHREQHDLYLRDVATGNETRLIQDTRRTYQPRLSPDGRRLAYQSDRAGNFDIWVLDLATRQQQQVTDHPADDHSPDWSPDSRQIVFFSHRETGPQLWLTRAEGGPDTPLSDRVAPTRARGSGVIGGPKWSPDGKLIGCVAPGQEKSTLWLVDVETLDVQAALPGVADFDWYKDSRRVIYTAAGGNDQDDGLLRVVDLKTRKSRDLLEQPHTEIAVAQDGSGVTFVAGPSHQRKQLWLLRLDEAEGEAGLPSSSGAPERLTDGADWHVHNGSWSRDGKSVVYVRDTLQADIYLLASYQ